jgi:hypothetical protein
MEAEAPNRHARARPRPVRLLLPAGPVVGLERADGRVGYCGSLSLAHSANRRAQWCQTSAHAATPSGTSAPSRVAVWTAASAKPARRRTSSASWARCSPTWLRQNQRRKAALPQSGDDGPGGGDWRSGSAGPVAQQRSHVRQSSSRVVKSRLSSRNARQVAACVARMRRSEREQAAEPQGTGRRARREYADGRPLDSRADWAARDPAAKRSATVALGRRRGVASAAPRGRVGRGHGGATLGPQLA